MLKQSMLILHSRNIYYRPQIKYLTIIRLLVSIVYHAVTMTDKLSITNSMHFVRRTDNGFIHAHKECATCFNKAQVAIAFIANRKHFLLNSTLSYKRGCYGPHELRALSSELQIQLPGKHAPWNNKQANFYPYPPPPTVTVH